MVVSYHRSFYVAGFAGGLTPKVAFAAIEFFAAAGGFKYNPPEGGQASVETTKAIENRA